MAACIDDCKVTTFLWIRPKGFATFISGICRGCGFGVGNKNREPLKEIPDGGAWRSRTALSGFADRYLTVRTTHPVLCLSGCKSKHFILFTQILWMKFYAWICDFRPFAMMQVVVWQADGLQCAFGGGQFVVVDVAFYGHLQAACQSLEDTLDLVVLVLSFRLDVEIHLGRVA